MSEERGPDETGPTLRQVWLVVVTTFLLFVVASFVSVLATGVPLEDPEALRVFFRRPSVLLGSVALSSVTFAVVAWWGARMPRAGSGVRARLGLVPAHPVDVVLVVGGTLGLGGAVDGVVMLLGFRDVGALMELRASLSELTTLQLVGAAAVIGIGPGIGEELFFRGFVMRRLAVLESPVHAWLASAVAFGLFHWDPVHTPAAIVMGVYLAVAVWRTGSLWPAIFAHVANNALATLTVRWPMNEGWAALSFGGGAVVAAAALYALFRRRARLSPAETVPRA